MCRNPVLWPQGQSFCRDQRKSFWLLQRSTYWHIQMPSVYCENRSIGWNNTVTGDNVPERDDLWSSFGFPGLGAFMWLPRQLQSQLLHWCHILLLTTPTWDCSSFFLLVSQQPSLLFPCLAPFFLLSHSLYTFISFPPSHPNNLNLISPLIALLPLWTSPFHLQLPAVADCQCLRVICGHFSFIILSKTGMALAQGDWVSVKHQDLIEFVPKWVIQGTLLIQSWGPIRLGGLAFPPTCCMLISLCTES